MRTLVVGLALSFLIGYTFRSLTSPSRVRAEIEKAASHIHNDVKVSFDSAELILSDGILPRFSVLIKNIQMQSDQACWMAPMMSIDELRLPLSVWGLIRGRGPVESVDAGIVQLELRGNLKDCKNAQSIPETSTTEPEALVKLSPVEQNDKYSNDVRSLVIHEFHIRSRAYPLYEGHFSDFTAKVKSFEPRVIEVRAKTQFMRDQRVGNYLSKANLFIEYKESPEAEVQAHFFGNWREGHYSFIATYFPSDRRLMMESDLKYIPLAQVLEILQRYKLVSPELNGKQVWISSKARWAGVVDQMREAPLLVRDLRMEGDIGEIIVDQIEFSKLDPLVYKPIRLDVRRMSVAKLLNLISRPSQARILGDLGNFDGVVDIRSEKSIEFRGEHKGLEFIFSNKGQRELQTIDRLFGTALFNGESWQIAVERVEPRGGTFLGSIKLKADPEFQNMEIQSRVDELTLEERVQKLMSNDGRIGSLSLDGALKITRGKMEKAKGLLHIRGMDVEGVQVGKTKISFEGKGAEVRLQTQIESLNISDSSPTAGVLKEVTETSHWQEQRLNFVDLSGQFVVNSGESFSWKNFGGKLAKNGTLSATGSWNGLGQLSGTVQRKEGRIPLVWELQGTREKPVLTLKTIRGTR